MRSMRVTLPVVVALTATTLIFTACQSPPPSSQASQTAKDTAKQQEIALERTISTQQRINRSFHSDVVPKLKSCWSRIQGEGMISFNYTYGKDASGRWAWESVRVDTATLPKGQDAVALKCMQESVRGMSFAVDESDGAGDKFDATWTWPVPFPVDADRQVEAMFAASRVGGAGGEGGGCDGKGAIARCYPNKCSYSRDGVTCPYETKVCVGWKTCYTARNTCNWTSPCASGGPFGVAGGLVMY